MSQDKNKSNGIRKINNDSMNEDLRRSVVHENPKPSTSPPRSREPEKPANDGKK